ncbi:PASTA domain protein [Bacteroides fragilis str. J38-1]|jgi:hypothetical protein|nr:PASTA domain protein [Bacteroides fragilis str. J38-1]
MFRNHGLTCVVSDSSYVKNKPSGIILDLNPSVGQKVKEGRTIYLTINTLSTPLSVVPDVADNSSVRQAQAKLIAAGFKLTENRMVSGEKDWVYGVIYQGRQLQIGDKAPIGATLTLMVGDGVQSTATDSVDMVENAAMSVEDSGTDDDSWF